MSAPPVTFEDRVEGLVEDLRVAVTTLRDTQAPRGKLSRLTHGRLVKTLERAQRTVFELRGAMDAYRVFALRGGPQGAVPGVVVTPLEDARPFHVSDEEMR